ncbi:MAG: DsbA family oxidoreductase [Tissierellales bacterium]
MYNIRVFSDFACPFCYFALGLVEKLKEDGIDYTIEWMPFELDPNAPLEGMDLFNVYPKEYVVNSINYLSKLGKDLGIIFNNVNSKFNTRRAHLAGYYAKDQNKYNEYSKSVFKAYFDDKLNIADKNVINEIAESIGLDVKEMNDVVNSGKYNERFVEDYKLASKYKVTSVPTFFINENIRISGIKEYNEFKKVFLEIVK